MVELNWLTPYFMVTKLDSPDPLKMVIIGRRNDSQQTSSPKTVIFGRAQLRKASQKVLRKRLGAD